MANLSEFLQRAEGISRTPEMCIPYGRLVGHMAKITVPGSVTRKKSARLILATLRSLMFEFDDGKEVDIPSTDITSGRVLVEWV